MFLLVTATYAAGMHKLTKNRMQKRAMMIMRAAIAATIGTIMVIELSLSCAIRWME